MNLAINMTGPTEALIIDLATAEFLDDHGAPKLIKPNPGTCGTLGYIAPELENPEASDDGEYGVEVDMFSLGVVALDMFKLLDAGMEWSSNPNPFRSPGRLTEITKYKAAVTHLYRKGNETSLDGLVARMLLRGPDARIQAFGALLHHAIADVPHQERQSLSMRHRLPENCSGKSMLFGLYLPVGFGHFEPRQALFRFAVFLARDFNLLQDLNNLLPIDRSL